MTSKSETVKCKDVLSRMQLFRNVDIDSVMEYLEPCVVRVLKMGDVLLSPKKKNNHLFILLSGNLYIHLKSLKSKPLNIIEPGEAVGEMSVFDNKYPSAYVVASKESKVLAISEETLWTLINNTNGIARNLLHTLADRIRYGHGTILDSERRARKHAKEAYLDPLTGIHNRRWLDNMFDSEIKRATIENSPVSLIMVDVDHFKAFNDTHGHLVGDMVLRIAADSMRRKIRPNDMIARYGGEEFCILLPETQLKFAARLAERLRVAVMNADLMDEKTVDGTVWKSHNIKGAAPPAGHRMHRNQ